MTNQPTTDPSEPRVTFWGAAHCVTGSMHLVEFAGRKILLDCGAVRGPRSRDFPDTFAFPPAELDAVVISHAHMDHCGDLPCLVHRGFRGPIYCTPPTRDLLALVLAVSARIQEEDAYVHQVIGHPDRPPAHAAFTQADANQAWRQCVAVPYREEREILPGVRLRLNDAGHILGSAVVTLTFAGGGRDYGLTFTGDLGRRESVLIRLPDPLPAADLLVSESTYGGRTVAPLAEAAAELLNVVRRTAERGGKVLIPAFSLGRMQIVVYILQQAMQAGRLPQLPVFVDSSLAADIADVYRRYPDCLQDDAARQLRAGDGFLGGAAVTYVRAHEEHKALTTRKEPCVILASSGMCQGGRILQHLKHHIDDPRCSVVLVNYQAPHTPGRKLLERGPTVRFHGRTWNKWADVVYLAGFSGHADQADLLAYLRPLAGRTGGVRLVHGEVDQAHELARALREAGFADVEAPGRGETACVA